MLQQALDRLDVGTRLRLFVLLFLRGLDLKCLPQRLALWRAWGVRGRLRGRHVFCLSRFPSAAFKGILFSK